MQPANERPSEEDWAKIYTREELRAALKCALDNAPEYGPLNESKVVAPEDMDYYADLIYDNAGTKTDISALLEEES